jgi:hypothetical protein
MDGRCVKHITGGHRGFLSGLLQREFGRTTVKTTKVRIGAVLAAVLVAGGTLAGAVATQDGNPEAGTNRVAHTEVVENGGEPIVYAGSYGLYPSK